MVTSCWCSTICKNRERTSVARCEAVSDGGNVAQRLTRGTRTVVDARRGSQQSNRPTKLGLFARSGATRQQVVKDWIEELLKSCGARRSDNGLLINRNKLGTGNSPKQLDVGQGVVICNNRDPRRC
ncbi:hypothetical protein NL676_004164 [Syzygium grande]|nr:hypothetical protein NL676_004164 [Syzygium grande]